MFAVVGLVMGNIGAWEYYFETRQKPKRSISTDLNDTRAIDATE